MGFKKACENIEFFKIKLRWSKLSWLLQRVVFLFCNLNCKEKYEYDAHIGNVKEARNH